MPWLLMAGVVAILALASGGTESGWNLVFLAGAALGAFLYFLPWVIAVERRAKAANGIILVDVLAGWTFIGWLVALVWAVSAPTFRSRQVAPAVPATKRCPECAEEVQAAANICRFCRYEFNDSSP